MPTPRLLLTAAALLLALGVSWVAAGGEPAKDETVSIDHIDGNKGTVVFNHVKHAEEFKGPGGATPTCRTCHHTLEADAPPPGTEVKACVACHVKEGGDKVSHAGKDARFLATHKGSGRVDQRTVVFHGSCREGCHKPLKAEGKRIHTCKTCHGG